MFGRDGHAYKAFRGAGRGITGFMKGVSGLGSGGRGFVGQTAFYAGESARWTAKFSGKAAREGLRATRDGARAYGSWRRGAAAELAANKAQADFLTASAQMNPNAMATKSQIDMMNKYGLQEDGLRRFGLRSPGEHMRKGFSNMFSPKYGVISPLSLGINVGLAAFMSDDNIFDPHNGMAKRLATNVGAEVGFVGGGTAGAMLAAALVPGGAVAAAIGFIGGGIIGSEAGAGVAELPWKFSEFGHKYGKRAIQKKSQFQDSEYAATMRQRAMQSIRRNHMSARSAFGQEALAYHA